jgi:hypothetical protein
VVGHRKAAFLSISALAVVGAILFADWRQWLPWPKLLHYRYTNFDTFQIYGKAPWCFLSNTYDHTADCHYLSQEHCTLTNAVFMGYLNKPEDRGLCVPNPLNSSAGVGRIPTVEMRADQEQP